MNKENNQELYNLTAVYNDSDGCIYSYSEKPGSVKQATVYLSRFYFPDAYTADTKKTELSREIIVSDDVVEEIITYHTENGNDNYVKALRDHVFHNRLVMIGCDIDSDIKKNLQPWHYNGALYDMFPDATEVDETDNSCPKLGLIIAKPQLIFISDAQLNNKKTFSKKDYDLFIDDIKSFLQICKDCAIERRKSLQYTDKINTADINDPEETGSLPEKITVHIGGGRDVDLVDSAQVYDFVQNVMFDENYFDDHKFYEIPDKHLVIQKKAGAYYIGDTETGTLEVYFSNGGSYKYKS